MDNGKNSVREALQILSVWDLWAWAPYPGKISPPARDGLYDNPFKPDKERTPSFSINKDGKVWKDFASGAGGGLIDFVLACEPGLKENRKELYRRLVEKAGLEWVDTRREFTDKERREWRREQREKERAALDATLRARKAALEFPSRSTVACQPAPAFVRARWAEGLAHRLKKAPKFENIDVKRGWPAGWAAWLNSRALLGFPELPWSHGGKHRGLAFPVQTYSGNLVGWHQIYVNFSTGEKNYLYVPRPHRAYSAGHTPFEKKVIDHAESLGLGRDARLVPALPLALGDLLDPSTIVITEGQWDALTLYAALFKEPVGGRPPSLGIFGIRGNEGTKAFLAEWGAWLKARRPSVILMPDNDTAGRKWITPQRRPGALPSITFQDQLTNAGLAVHVVEIPKAYGKDFNDYYKARKPATRDLNEWLKILQT